jgi:hypothetical protein
MFYEPKDGHGLPDGRINIARLLPIGRMGYQDYTRVAGETLFTMDPRVKPKGAGVSGVGAKGISLWRLLEPRRRSRA